MKTSVNHRFIGIFLLALMVWAVSGCSTRRNTAQSRFYHRLTSHYNVYWNGEQSYMEGLAVIKQNAKDDYNEVLPVFNYGDKKLAQQVKSKMERAIKKASLTIQEHSMVFNGKEEIPWVGKSYLLMGRAHFMEQNYTAARRVFDFVSKQYARLPFQYVAMLWLSKTYIAEGSYEKAQAQLNLLRTFVDEVNFPVEVKKQMPLVEANLYIAMKDYETAYRFLEQALRTCTGRDECTRIMFILGQINQLEQHYGQATNYYKKVIKRNPVFQMSFEARLRLATSYDSTHQDLKFVQKVLEKMAKNHVYQAYLGQIYFAMALVAERNHQDTLVIYQLRRSVAASSKDNAQRAVSALKLAQIYFSGKKYLLSRAYYDTTLMSMSKDNPKYAELDKTASVLTELSKYLTTIQKQDSLQALSFMDTTRLYALIDQRIISFRKNKEKKQEASDQPGVQQPDLSNSYASSLQDNAWYFYNPVVRTKGYNDFVSRWGQRKLEDLWFLSSKNGGFASQLQMAENNDQRPENSGSKRKSQISGQILQTSSDPEQRGYYLKDIPRGPQAMLHSDSLIKNAYEKAGFLYLDALHDTTQAIKMYQSYLNRFPENKKKIQIWYTLYSLYSFVGNNEKAVEFKSLILQNFPNSIYARVVQNPDYYKSLISQQKMAREMYERTYKAYSRGQYYRVIDYANKAQGSYGSDSLLMPRFLYLKAISLGKVEVPDSMYYALQDVINKYPKSDLVPKARSLIKMLQLEYGIGISPAERAALLAKEKQKKGNSPFVFDPNAPQQIMLMVNKKQVQVSALKVRLSDFNRKQFNAAHLSISSLELNQEYSLVLVKDFLNAADAQTYYNVLKTDNYVFSGMNPKVYQLFVISLKNYPLFYRDKNIEAYSLFFKSNYKE
ncbi:MAG: tetratricopeptide repeat protein [Bacteroidales bacterium]|nr:tetratricopeptide repeat protein [Bacteroidales bacterium]